MHGPAAARLLAALRGSRAGVPGVPRPRPASAQGPRPRRPVRRAASAVGRCRPRVRRTDRPRSGRGRPARPGAPSAVGAARAGALLERQLTLARTRAHSATLQALGSSRFHAVADAVAVLASEVPLHPARAPPPPDAAAGPGTRRRTRLLDAAAALPLARAAHPYNAEALVSGLGTASTADRAGRALAPGAPLLRLHRYAQEVLRAREGRPTRCWPTRARPWTGTATRPRRRPPRPTRARTPRIAPATAYALGVLHADQRHEVEAARFAFQQVWQKTTVGAMGSVGSL